MVGGGFMARTHAHAARAAGAHVVALTSSSRESAERAARALGVPETAPDVVALARQVDVVHVCSPNAVHAAHALAAIEAGAHVVCEKPLATSAGEAAVLVRAADEAGVTATVPFVYRFHPMVREARARVAAGAVGRLLTVRGTYLQDWMLDAGADDWRVDPEAGGPSRAFADIGSHLVDLLEFVAGDQVVRLAATIARAHPVRAGRPVLTEDAAAVVVETRGGAVGTLLVSQVSAGRKNALTVELAGTAGAVQVEQERPDELWLGRPEGATVLARDPARLSPDAARLSTVPAGHPMGYLDAFEAFARDTYARVRGEEPDGLPRFADGLRAARLTDAVLRAAASGTWVPVDHSEGAP
ncbi:gfo/Idh/MocA family oxidoreductase [Xylanimonas oleitrophica]|uniref:Gfo/Idh/MocA family oxidoreductase n=1 Tax=Xylanimonas oleitrophica TaxID=2607479 RepID=A0A2W5WL51_9MICO|nr:gfo/Idh/MocA family oxidoreductase [Xylanimonas oleitrophica]